MVPGKSIALITGAGRSTGIGFEVARQLATRNIEVILTARDPEAATTCAAELAADGLAVTGRALDVRDADAIARLAIEIEQKYGHLDILINNAAGMSHYDEQAADRALRALCRLDKLRDVREHSGSRARIRVCPLWLLPSGLRRALYRGGNRSRRRNPLAYSR
jgi:NAD(P)-dependent dehydrogenase (short-subunit alcohol dehydrogenase family)